jgi:rod shape-determining protein MreC
MKPRTSFALTTADIRYIALACSLLVLVAFSVKFPVFNERASSVVIRLSEPFIVLSKQPGDVVQNTLGYLSKHTFIVERNNNLQARQQHMLMMEHELKLLARENMKLKALLSMVDDMSGAPLTAYVLADSSSAFTHSILINSGEQDGVVKGQEVVNAEGLVGRVVSVQKNTSRILLLTDYASRVPVKFLNANVQGIIRGVNTESLELLFLEKDREIKVGDTVVSSGIGGVYSEGTPIGRVESIDDGTIRIKPSVDFSILEIVTIQRKKVEGILDVIRTE